MAGYRTVKQGEGLSSIAAEEGFDPQTIWQDPLNEDLTKRGDMNILLPDDTLWIPGLSRKEHACSVDRRYIFRVPSVPARFRLQVFSNGKKVAGASYRLLVDDVLKQGSTDEDGVLDEFVSPGSKIGTLVVEPPAPAPPLTFRVQFGVLDPADTHDGVLKRLRNLGYVRPVFGQSAARATWDAVRRFQRDHGLPMTGVPDATTLSKLQILHDSRELFPLAASSGEGGSSGDR